jgi:hypothetical protein
MRWYRLRLEGPLSVITLWWVEEGFLVNRKKMNKFEVLKQVVEGTTPIADPDLADFWQEFEEDNERLGTLIRGLRTSLNSKTYKVFVHPDYANAVVFEAIRKLGRTQDRDSFILEPEGDEVRIGFESTNKQWLKEKEMWEMVNSLIAQATLSLNNSDIDKS